MTGPLERERAGFATAGSRAGPEAPLKMTESPSSHPPVADGPPIHESFRRFLGIQAPDERLVLRHAPVLLAGGERFAQAFYEYLLADPAVGEVLARYQERGGRIRDLVAKQYEHLSALLSRPFDAAGAERLARIGEIHYRAGIEPVWVMGAYLLYWRHLHALIHASGEIPDAERAPLQDAVIKLLYRDMGIMLEGYWDAAMGTLRRKQEEVAALQQRVDDLLRNLPQVLWSVDVVHNAPIYISPHAGEICELGVEMPIPCLNWTVPEDRPAVKAAWRRALRGQTVEVESRVQAPGGGRRWLRRVFRPFRDDEGRVVRIDGLLEDATESKRVREQLRTLAITDSLTGLHNRALFHDRLVQALALARRRADSQLAVLSLDLDHFKEINDTLGHPAGDEILRMAAARLREVVRESDTVARLGGDEFAILLTDVRDARDAAAAAARKVVAALRPPFRFGDDELYLGASCGIALYPEHGDDADSLMRHADVALYGAKHRDVDFLFYDAAEDPRDRRRLQLGTELRGALAGGGLLLHYQPIVALDGGRTTAVEALVRWDHPEFGLLAPERFVPLAERTGVINALTAWVLSTALAQHRAWHDEGHDVRVAVNLAGRTLRRPGFAADLEALLEAAGAAPDCLQLEIAETVLRGEVALGAGGVRRLREAGVVIAMDDYGTGHTSLAHLKELPLDVLKIDKSFIMGMASDPTDALIVRSTIDLAHNLGCSVVAEGVEDARTLELLASLHCDAVQGFHFCRPLDPTAMSEWLAARRGRVGSR